MDLKQIEALLEKYYNGEASIEEEKILRTYFEGSNISDDLIADRDIFLYNLNEIEIQDSLPDLSEEIWEGINNEQIKIDNKTTKRINYRLMRIAAGFIVLFASYFLLKNEIFDHTQTIQYTDTYKTPEQAYQETKKTLLYVSQLLNSGTGHLEPINKIEEGAKKLDPLSAFNQGLNELDPIKKYAIGDKYIKQ
jgi:hypothetical protein